MNEEDRKEVERMITEAQLRPVGFFGGVMILINKAMNESRMYLLLVVVASYLFAFLLISDLLTPQLLEVLFSTQAESLIKGVATPTPFPGE